MDHVMGEVTLDFVAKGQREAEWQIVLIENGPWDNSRSDHLVALQKRLYDVVDIVLDGNFARKYPESAGSDILVTVHCYNLEPEYILPFFKRFADHAMQSTDYANDLQCSPWVQGLRFDIEFFEVPEK
jgi:hypothetical protein